VLFEVRLTDRAQWLLSHLPPDARDRIVGCIQALRRNPYRDLEERVTLVWPLERVYRDAYRCGDWAIAYEFQDEDTLLIEAIGNLFQ
jgi:mRNA-degrading endonuclease RelE of RelBE toxin-antitoxin system